MTKQALDVEYRKLEKKVQQLTKEEKSLWRRHHGNSSSFDRDAFFAEIEAKGVAPDATVSAKKEYETLQKCRAAREELAELASRLRNFCEPGTLPQLSTPDSHVCLCISLRSRILTSYTALEHLLAESRTILGRDCWSRLLSRSRTYPEGRLRRRHGRLHSYYGRAQRARRSYPPSALFFDHPTCPGL